MAKLSGPKIQPDWILQIVTLFKIMGFVDFTWGPFEVALPIHYPCFSLDKVKSKFTLIKWNWGSKIILSYIPTWWSTCHKLWSIPSTTWLALLIRSFQTSARDMLPKYRRTNVITRVQIQTTFWGFLLVQLFIYIL